MRCNEWRGTADAGFEAQIAVAMRRRAAKPAQLQYEEEHNWVHKRHAT